MPRNAARLLTCILATAPAASSGCGLLGPDSQEFVIQIDSIGGPSAAPVNAAFQQFFYGFVGPDGCHRFKEFKLTRNATGADITVIGTQVTGGGDCTDLVVYLRGEPLTIDPPISDPFTVRVHQRDGTVLTRIIRPE
jgi:hypothetical protein